MMTIDDIRKDTGINDIHCTVSGGLTFDYRLFNSMLSDDFSYGYNRYDFDVYLKDFGRNLQRPYVWEYCQKNEFIRSLMLEKHIEPVVIVLHTSEDGKQTLYVIDGKQRLLTIHKFLHNEFPISVGGCEVFWKDFDRNAQTFFRQRVNSMTGNVYYSDWMIPLTDREKIILFNHYNFSGTPQTEEHKKMLKELISFEK
jgi:hypothetical protein